MTVEFQTATVIYQVSKVGVVVGRIAQLFSLPNFDTGTTTHHTVSTLIRAYNKAESQGFPEAFRVRTVTVEFQIEQQCTKIIRREPTRPTGELVVIVFFCIRRACATVFFCFFRQATDDFFACSISDASIRPVATTRI